MARRGVNPRTGKRYEWEEAQEAKRRAAQEDEALDKHLKLLRRQQKAIEAREKLIAFTEFTMPDADRSDDVRYSAYKAARHHLGVAAALEQVVKGTIPILILTMPPRHGKLCSHDTLVPTPLGFVRHGELRPGDFVFGVDGKPTRVVAVSGEGVADVEVEFTNGERVVVHENHEWTVYDRRAYPARSRTLETKALMADCWIGPLNTRGGRARWQLPEAKALDFPAAAAPPLHPYALGVWLGDGSTAKAHITGVDQEIFDAIAACSGFHETGRWVHSGAGVTAVSFSGPRPNVRGRLSEALHCLGLFGDKHIPPQYRRASRGERLQLLAGLMDADGHVEKETGWCRIVTGSERLAADIFELCAGLGFRPYIARQQPTLSSSGIQGNKVVYTVGFQPYERLPVRLERKQVHKYAKRRRVAIKAIRRVPAQRGRCIQVERSDGLYLVGRNLIPTHNSELVSRRLPAWLIGRFPNMSGIVATYNDDFAMDFGKDVRGIVRSLPFRQIFPGVALQRGGGASDRLQTTAGGQWSFVGRGGSLTGRGGHMLICDDLIKDDREAQSQAIRDQAWSWFTKVAMSRRMGKKSVILTFTRWHADDPIGRLTDPENPHYNERLARRIKIINLPAIAEDDDPLGREPGEALWPDGPDRFDLDFLEEQRALDPIGFEALYQQRPSLADGDLFKREDIRYYGPGTGFDLPEDLQVYCASDHAVGTKQRNDPSVLLKGGVDRQGNLYLLDCYWRRSPADVIVEQMLNMGGRGAQRPIVWWAESGHISKSLGPFLRKRMAEENAYFVVREITPVADKATRAQSIAGRVATGRVFFPAGSPWTERAINEMMAFPSGLHDDFVDALALFGLGLQSQFGPGKARESKRAKEPAFGTLNWVKQQDKWAEKQRQAQMAGGF